MARDVERYLRIQRLEAAGWRNLPNGERVRLLQTSNLDAADGTKLTLFHIAFMPGLGRGQRITYLGSTFELREVSESKQLVGIELRCSAIS